MLRPALTAKFLLDEQGNPRVVKTPDGLNHYWLKLEVDGTTSDTYAVTYQLHDSYYEPVKESHHRQQAFAKELTSFGDYIVKAQIRSRHRSQTIASQLTSALERGHLAGRTDAINRAIEDIRSR